MQISVCHHPSCRFFHRLLNNQRCWGNLNWAANLTNTVICVGINWLLHQPNATFFTSPFCWTPAAATPFLLPLLLFVPVISLGVKSGMGGWQVTFSTLSKELWVLPWGEKVKYGKWEEGKKTAYWSMVCTCLCLCVQICARLKRHSGRKPATNMGRRR